MPIITDSLVLLVYQIDKNIWHLLILIKTHRKSILTKPSHKSKLIFYLFCYRPLTQITTDSHIHGVLFILRRQVHPHLKLHIHSVVNKRPWTSHSQISLIFLWQLCVLLYRVIFLLNWSLDQYATDIIWSVIRIKRIFSFGFVVFADSLRTIEINPLHFVITIYLFVTFNQRIPILTLFQQFRNT